MPTARTLVEPASGTPKAPSSTASPTLRARRRADQTHAGPDVLSVRGGPRRDFGPCVCHGRERAPGPTVIGPGARGRGDSVLVQDICKVCLATSARPSSVMLHRVESKAGHHSHHQAGTHPGRGRPHLRPVRSHGQPAWPATETRVTAPSNPGPGAPGAPSDRGRDRRSGPAPAQAAPRGRAALGVGRRPVTMPAPRRWGWHLAHHHAITLSRATIHRILTRHGAVTPEPKKRPKSSYIRFEAAMPRPGSPTSRTTHSPTPRPSPRAWRSSPGDDCTRYEPPRGSVEGWFSILQGRRRLVGEVVGRSCSAGGIHRGLRRGAGCTSRPIPRWRSRGRPVRATDRGGGSALS